MSAAVKKRRIITNEPEDNGISRDLPIPVQVPQQQMNTQVSQGNMIPHHQNQAVQDPQVVHNLTAPRQVAEPTLQMPHSNQTYSSPPQVQVTLPNRVNAGEKKRRKRKPVKYTNVERSKNKILNTLGQLNSGLSLLDWMILDREAQGDLLAAIRTMRASKKKKW
ncbi:uncharacterized protein B0P05DRAFT_599654 [Gilbertella persicaria]|uniref:uncharacterized protein n=1 Tax=Gilbertella persicaria TaxID=101096 RepID=UPI00221F6A1D|nr:uncharacterized protein B0P05DRAFT_599654 [Gilbertella persicaria]KAI8060372.1 hypothetical protein B0P05DRAFT_599654 [Gilbertella persicaria]